MIVAIGIKAFEGSLSLKEIEIPPSIKILEKGTFRLCTSLVDINITQFCFDMCSSFEKIEIPASIINIENNAFLYCTSLQLQLDIIIENSTFKECESLIEISIPSIVNTIGRRAFNDCKNMKSIILPYIKTIERETFRNYFSLKSNFSDR